MFGKAEFLDQFWAYFKEKHPNLLDEIESQDKLAIYVQHLEKKGFSLTQIIEKAPILHEEFKESETEKTAITKTITNFQEYCKDNKKQLPANVFNDFMKEIGAETDPEIIISPDGKIKKMGDLIQLWNNFLEANNIKLKENQKKQCEDLLTPDYLPTERLLITTAVKKIKKYLPKELEKDFDEQFASPITIFSKIQNLKELKNQRQIFLETNKEKIDKNLAKKLDGIIVTNGDIYKELRSEGISINRTKGFGEQENNFRRIFNKLATRQLFDEAKEGRNFIEKNVENIADTFRQFPPYINEIFAVYPYDYNEIVKSDTEFSEKYNKASEEIKSIEDEIAKETTPEEKRKSLREELKKKSQTLNIIKRNGYAKYIETKDEKAG